jgi:hypothetical protein
MCRMGTARGAPGVSGRGNRLLVRGLTGLARSPIVWYSNCTYRESVGMYHHRNILPVSDV